MEFLATSPDGLKSIGFQKPSAVSYAMPSGYFTQEGLASHEGAIEYYYYRTSDQFVEQILLPKLETALATGLQVSGAMPIASGRGYSAGLYEFLYSKDGIDFVMQMIVTTYAGVITPSGRFTRGKRRWTPSARPRTSLANIPKWAGTRWVP